MTIKVKEKTLVDFDGCSQNALDSLVSLGSLKISGNVFLNYCTKLTKLPDGLIVGGHLDLWMCTSLTKLPDEFRVNGDLNLYGCSGLMKLPDDLNVAGDLNLCGCKGIQSLPVGLNVNGNICYDSETGFHWFEGDPGVIPDHLRNKLKFIS